MATLMRAFLHNAGRQISSISSNSTPQILDAVSYVPPQLTQVLFLWGHRPSSGSAPSQSAVQVFGTIFLSTSGTFILLLLFAKPLRLICLITS